MPKRNLAWVAVIALIAAAFWKLPQTAARFDTLDRTFGALLAVRAQIARHYVDPVDDATLVDGAIRGMLHELDPHSVYISAEDLAEFTKQAEGRFGGIGIELTEQVTESGRQLIVTSPIENTPAYRAGVLAGDHILAIDGVSTRSTSAAEAVRRISGEPGTSVTLTLYQPGREGPRDITVERAEIHIASVQGWYRKHETEWAYFVDEDAKIAYVRISSFVADTASELKRTVDFLREQGLRGLVLDLRDNGGGLFESAVDVTDLFLERGTIVSTRRQGKLLSEWTASPEGTFPEFPVAVLINRLSASAAEIVAGALLDHGRATTVGERSYGKGSVQNVYELPHPQENARVKLTVAYYHLPGGKCIHRKSRDPNDDWGVAPDESLAMSDEELYQMRRSIQQAGVIRAAATQPATSDGDDLDTTQDATPRPPELDRHLARAVEILREKLNESPTRDATAALP